jgi:hypothetical protein
MKTLLLQEGGATPPAAGTAATGPASHVSAAAEVPPAAPASAPAAGVTDGGVP